MRRGSKLVQAVVNDAGPEHNAAMIAPPRDHVSHGGLGFPAGGTLQSLNALARRGPCAPVASPPKHGGESAKRARIGSGEDCERVAAVGTRSQIALALPCSEGSAQSSSSSASGSQGSQGSQGASSVLTTPSAPGVSTTPFAPGVSATPAPEVGSGLTDTFAALDGDSLIESLCSLPASGSMSISPASSLCAGKSAAFRAAFESELAAKMAQHRARMERVAQGFKESMARDASVYAQARLVWEYQQGKLCARIATMTSNLETVETESQECAAQLRRFMGDPRAIDEVESVDEVHQLMATLLSSQKRVRLAKDDKFSNELHEKNNMVLCVICRVSPRDSLTLPCTHLTMCGECLRRVMLIGKQCPVCREPIASVVAARLS
jgi:hypothetical protein